jgi:hypothetical protein
MSRRALRWVVARDARWSARLGVHVGDVVPGRTLDVLAAVVNNESHLWRQRFPDGSPEQLTFGTNQERGLVVEPDGRSLITSVGGTQSAVWYHDETGERAVSVEGYAYRPLVSPDGSKVFYLVRRAARRSFSIGELLVLTDFLVRSYHVSRDGRLVVFDAFDEKDRSQVWLATTDRSQAPRRLTPDGSVEEQRPFFGGSGDIYFMQEQSQDARSSRSRSRSWSISRQTKNGLPCGTQPAAAPSSSRLPTAPFCACVRAGRAQFSRTLRAGELVRRWEDDVRG